MTESQLQTDQIRIGILDAAQKRFRRYGYGKTTMAEIAEDVNMSAANLYRYFHSKQGIAVECADRCMAELHLLLKNVVDLPNLDAIQRLHMFVQTALHFFFEMMHDAPRLNELVENITTNHPQLIHERNQNMESLVARILQQGVDGDEFLIEDVNKTAAAVVKATALFSTPFFMQLYSLEQFEKMAVNVVTLMINGLRK
ncbi:MAG: TetR/AcrR family transcriptional regulator [Arenicellales bacterium]